MPSDDRLVMPEHVEILVVGAGMAGLTAARRLVDAGRDVLVVDKGWNPGGRMATRVTDRARFDHGATFFYAAPAAFQADLQDWADGGAAGVWSGIGTENELWRGTPDMRTLGQHLARGMRVAMRTRLAAVGREGERWRAVTEEGESVHADAVLMTSPVPQTLDLLAAGDAEPEGGLARKLGRVSYEQCFVVMAELDGPGCVPAPGFVEPEAGPLVRVVDEKAKGVSAVPAVTLHATSEFSRSRWDSDRGRVTAEILRAAEPWLGCAVVSAQIHGWRYARPVSVWPEPCLVACEDSPLILAGDAFGGPDVPGAHRSGLEAAAALVNLAFR